MDYIVIKEYAGIKVGTKIICVTPARSEYMVGKGYWKLVPAQKPKKSEKVQPLSGRKKKVVEPKRKKK